MEVVLCLKCLKNTFKNKTPLKEPSNEIFSFNPFQKNELIFESKDFFFF